MPVSIFLRGPLVVRVVPIVSLLPAKLLVGLIPFLRLSISCLFRRLVACCFARLALVLETIFPARAFRELADGPERLTLRTELLLVWLIDRMCSMAPFCRGAGLAAACRLADATRSGAHPLVRLESDGRRTRAPTACWLHDPSKPRTPLRSVDEAPSYPLPRRTRPI